MIDITQDIQPLTTFRNNSVASLRQLKTGRAIILTVNGKPEAAVLSAAAYQRLLDAASAADERKGLRQAEADVAAGRTRPATEFFTAMRKKRGLQR